MAGMGGHTPFEVRAEGFEMLRGRWHELTSRYTDSRPARDAAFRSIVQCYSAETRAYHNLSHIKALIHLYDEFKRNAGYDPILFAIWYHDIIYDTRRHDNEDISADFARDALGTLGVPSVIVWEVDQMIRATKRHDSENLSADGELFLDLDISILGASPELYREYGDAIRREYDWVPWPIYRQARSGILRDFLRPQRIFFTEQMSARFDDQARRNIEQELKELAE
jgi:predicted metal-dependent HD superfamily phosphohydrolase